MRRARHRAASALGAWLVVVGVGLAPAVSAGGAVPPEPKGRVAHHLKAVDDLARHLQGVMAAGCPRFPTPGEWTAYFDSEVDRVVLLMAHLEQAWLEAKKTPDDDLRRTAKAPRKRAEEARALVDKLQVCAEEHGAPFAPLTVWRRVERDVPRRQVEIALPE